MARNRMQSFRGGPPRPTMDDRNGYIANGYGGRGGGRIGGNRGEALYFDDYSSTSSWTDSDRRRGEWVGDKKYPTRDPRPVRQPRYPQDSFESSEYSHDHSGYYYDDRRGGPGRGRPPIGMGRRPSPTDMRRPPSPQGRGMMYGRGASDRRNDFEDRSYGYSTDDSFSEARKDAPISRRGPQLAVDHIAGTVHDYPRKWGVHDGDSRSIETPPIQWRSAGRGTRPIETSRQLGPKDHDPRSVDAESFMRSNSLASSSVPSRDISPRRWQRRDMSFSSDTVSSYDRRMEYEGAKPSPDLPQGYLRRKDGVVLSMGSSMGSVSDVTDRYIDPETAAQALVENLESKGYEYTKAGGITMSASSTSIASQRYDMNPTKKTQPTKKPLKGPTKMAQKNQLTSLQKVPKSKAQQPAVPVVRSFEEAAHGAQQIPCTAGRAKVKKFDDNTSDPLGASLGSRDTSNSGSVFRAKAKAVPGRGSPVSAHSKDSGSAKAKFLLGRGGNSVSTHSKDSGSQGKRFKKQQQAKPVRPVVPAVPVERAESKSPVLINRGFDVSRLMEDTLSRADTTHNDESTISTKEKHLKQFPAILKTMRSGMTEKAVVDGEDGESETVERTISKKSVGFCGEMPPPTKAGDRVPEMVARLPTEVLPSVSDMSSMPRSGQSTASAVPLHGTALDRMERFVEQFALTCRLAVFQPGSS